MTTPRPTGTASRTIPKWQPTASNLLQRKCACGNHTMAGGTCTACQQSEARQEVPSIAQQVIRGTGSPLDNAVRQKMRPRFGDAVGDVRVHTGSRAASAAEAVRANAYTVGRDIVFGSGQYEPHTPKGEGLLAHEMTHVLQQRSAGLSASSAPLTMDRENSAAEQEAVRQESADGNIRESAPPSLQRQPNTGGNAVSDPNANRTIAQVDLGTGDTVSPQDPRLVELANTVKAQIDANPRAYVQITVTTNRLAPNTDSPGVESEKMRVAGETRAVAIRAGLVKLGVPADRIQYNVYNRAYESEASPTDGHTTVEFFRAPFQFNLLPGVPGLTPGTPSPGPVNPTPTPLTPAPGAAPASASPSLGDMLTFKFKGGPVEFAVELPKSVSAKLPVALSTAKSLTFELKAEASGTFSFSVTLNGLPHLRVGLKSSLSVDKDKGTSGSAGLEIQLTRTVCSADNPELLKQKVTAAGEKLKKAGSELSTAKPDERLSKLIDLGSAIGDMYDAVDKSKSACKQVPAATFSFGVQGPLAPTTGALNDPDPTKRPATYVGPTLTIPF